MAARRWLVRVLLAIVIGVLVTVVGTGALAYSARPALSPKRFVAERRQGPSVREFWLVNEGSAFGVRQVVYAQARASAWVDEGLAVEEDIPDAPAWAPWPPEPRPALGERVVHAAVGWPFRCAAAKRVERVTDEAGASLENPLLPYRPLPLGLLLNTLTIAAIVLLLGAGAPWVPRGRLLTVLGCLALGAALNVGVAWGCAISFGAEPDWRGGAAPLDDEDHRWLAAAKWSATNQSPFVAHLVVYATDAFGAQVRHLAEQWRIRDIQVLGRERVFGRQVRAGWPLPSMTGGHVLRQPIPKPVRILGTPAKPPPAAVRGRTVDAIPIDWIPGPPQYSAGPDLPLRPMPSGFVVNTAVYAAALWLLVVGRAGVRRLVRGWRGLCPRCAYPAGEAAVCSECGGRLPGASNWTVQLASWIPRMRSVLVVLGCGALGAALNVGVAWGSAIFFGAHPDWVDGAPIDDEDRRWLAAANWSPTGQWRWEPHYVACATKSFGAQVRHLVEQWRNGDRQVPGQERVIGRQVRAGWPLPSMVGGHVLRQPIPKPVPRVVERLRSDGTVATVRILEAPPGPRPAAVRRRMVDAIAIDWISGPPQYSVGPDLPLRPLPSGFVVNTAAYAAALWLLVVGRLGVRRLVRRWRNSKQYARAESLFLTSASARTPSS